MPNLSSPLESVLRGLYYLVFNLTRAVTAFVQQDSFLYWPFLISTLALALAVALWGRRAGDEPATAWGRFRRYFSAGLWWHRSARVDYALYFVNALIFPALAAALVFNQFGFAAWVDRLLSFQPAAAAEAGLGVRLAYTVVFFVAYDFGRFVGHSLLHDVAFLWPFHKVHHSAEVLTPMTAYRVHPVELLIMAWVPTLCTGAVTWGFNRFAGAGISFYSFLGLHAFIWVFSLIDNLRHSPVWLPYGPRLGRWLVSPAHHQLHHSVEPRHWGRNRGSDLAVWDRLYGTLWVPADEPEQARLGLGDGSEPKWHGLWHCYAQPFRESWSCLLDALRSRRRQRA
jgi:sterol desaturase/sphingolipid hydroxylase (fatty acid hydroxylase superfamily)